jgi:hypothetical protein
MLVKKYVFMFLDVVFILVIFGYVRFSYEVILVIDMNIRISILKCY